MAKNLVLWVIIALVLMMVFKNFGNPAMSGDIPYSQFISKVKTGNVVSVSIEGNSITGKMSDNTRFTTYSPETSNDALIGTLLENNVEIKGMEPNRNSFWAHALISWFPILLLLGIWIYFMRQMQGGGGGRGALSFGKSRARLLSSSRYSTLFGTFFPARTSLPKRLQSCNNESFSENAEHFRCSLRKGSLSLSLSL